MDFFRNCKNRKITPNDRFGMKNNAIFAEEKQSLVLLNS